MFIPPRSGAENMARDFALMERARRTGEAVLSVYGWQRPTLSFGRNQEARGCYDLDRIANEGIGVVRRPTGGRAMMHYREVTYSVTAPLGSQVRPRAWYSRINRLLVDGLRRGGIDAGEAGLGTPTTPLDSSPCFATPARGEVMVHGRKLIGSAQWRYRDALLQHGSILIENDQHLIRNFLVPDANPAAPAPATLAAVLGVAPDAAFIAAWLFDAVRNLEDPEADSIEESEVRQAALDGMAQFENESWTWRR